MIPPKVVCPSLSITPVRFRHYSRDNSVFAGDDYLIRGVAGAVMWRMLREFQVLGRTRFASRELRAAGSELGLPEVGDNLSTRLITLAQRLDLLAAPVGVQRLGGGRLQLIVSGTLSLESD